MMWMEHLELRAPEYLWALLAVPILWWLLRLIPPEAARRRFPSLALFDNLPRQRSQTAFTPLWLLLLRSLLVIMIIFIFTEPVLELGPSRLAPPEQPVIIMIDNCWASASNWTKIKAKAASIIKQLPPVQNVAVLAACPPDINYVITKGLINPLQAQQYLKQLDLRNETMQLAKIINALRSLDLAPIAQLNFISGGVMTDSDAMTQIARELNIYDDIRIFLPSRENLPIQLTAIEKGKELSLNAIRIANGFEQDSEVLVHNNNDELLTVLPVEWQSHEKITNIPINTLLPELANASNFSIPNKGFTATYSRQPAKTHARIGILARPSPDDFLNNSQIYLEKSLIQKFYIITGDWNGLLTQDLPVIFVPYPDLPSEYLPRINNWIQKGGQLVRFASNTFNGEADILMPSTPIKIINIDQENLLNDTKAQMQIEATARHIVPMPHAQFKSYWLMSPASTPDTSVIARLDNSVPLVLSKSIGKGKSIFVTTPLTPQAGDWMLQKGFPEFLESITALNLDQRALHEPKIDFERLVPLIGNDSIRDAQISDLSTPISNLSLAPYLILLCLLIFMIDQILIIIRFTGLPWQRQ